MRIFGLAALLMAAASSLAVVGAPGIAAAEAQPKRLAAFFDLLGAQTPYLEREFGPAKYVQGGVRTYVVEGCEVFVRTARNSVLSIGLRLSPKCTMARAGLSLDGRAPENPTFGSFYSFQPYVRFTTHCLKDCGNAFDPEVIGTFTGYHANNFIGYRVGSSQSEGRTLDAANRWEQAMEKAEGEGWVIGAKFNCTDRYDDTAKQLFKDIPIQWVEIGFFDNVEGCADPARPALRR